jgi:hypothetical protein
LTEDAGEVVHPVKAEDRDDGVLGVFRDVVEEVFFVEDGSADGRD